MTKIITLKFHRQIKYGHHMKEKSREDIIMKLLKNIRGALKHTSELPDHMLKDLCILEEYDEL